MENSIGPFTPLLQSDSESMKLLPRITCLRFFLAALLFLPVSLRVSGKDLDQDRRPNATDPDVDNDGIPNGKDRNVDGGRCRKGRLKGRYIGDRLSNGSRGELDIDADGRRDDADSEKDMDGDRLSDDSPREDDIDGDGLDDDSDEEDDIDGDGRFDDDEDEDDTDGDGIDDTDDVDDDGDGVDDEDDLTAFPAEAVGERDAPASPSGPSGQFAWGGDPGTRFPGFASAPAVPPFLDTDPLPGSRV